MDIDGHEANMRMIAMKCPANQLIHHLPSYYTEGVSMSSG
jgi:hypothetical protein